MSGVLKEEGLPFGKHYRGARGCVQVTVINRSTSRPMPVLMLPVAG
jgi:hypothetical protein